HSESAVAPTLSCRSSSCLDLCRETSNDRKTPTSGLRLRRRYLPSGRSQIDILMPASRQWLVSYLRLSRRKRKVVVAGPCMERFRPRNRRMVRCQESARFHRDFHDKRCVSIFSWTCEIASAQRRVLCAFGYTDIRLRFPADSFAGCL